MNVQTIASNGYSFQVEMTYRAFLSGCRMIESPIIFTERRSGKSKMSEGIILESALMPWRLRLRRRRLMRLINAEDSPEKSRSVEMRPPRP
jgi:dolichol-phosphate mannosyltransferase